MIGVFCRLYFLQILYVPFYSQLAKQQYEIALKVLPPRATVFDRSGLFPLAMTKVCTSAFIVPKQLLSHKKSLDTIKKQFPAVYQKLQSAKQDKKFLWLERKMSEERSAQLASLGLEGIYFVDEGARFYTTTAAEQVLGAVDIDNNGIAGIELFANRQLGGVAREYIIEKDARSASLYFSKNVINHGVTGQPITLTIDAQLQDIVFDELKKTLIAYKAEEGAALVLDPASGEILAMANVESTNLNCNSINRKNMVVSESYELGSVMKTFSALAALDEGVVAADEIIDCGQRIVYVNGVKVENPTITLLNKLKETNGMLTFTDVIRYSSNVGTAKVALRLGTKLYDNLKKLGFGSKTGVDFPGERAGFIRHPRQWSGPSLIVMSFGYEMMGSLLQLGQAFSIIAMNGTLITPHLEKDIQPKQKKALFKSSSTNELKKILSKFPEKYTIPGFNLWGKTGTARCVVDGKYSTKKHQFTYAGVIEKDNYKRVIVTFIKNPEKANLWASEVSLPLFATIAKRMLVKDILHNGLEAA